VRFAAIQCENDNPMQGAQKPLELILARNLLTSISTPAFLVDHRGALLFYNEAAGALLGISFEEAGQMDPEEWGAKFGPFDSEGERIPVDELPLTIALRDGKPAHASLCIHAVDGGSRDIEVSALPISAAEISGAMAIFWPVDERSGNGEAQG
jgi:PAS domain-containing protein